MPTLFATSLIDISPISKRIFACCNRTAVIYSVYDEPVKKSFSAFVEKVKEFLNGYDSNEIYKQFVQSGTGSKENVRGRFDYWREIVRNIQFSKESGFKATLSLY